MVVDKLVLFDGVCNLCDSIVNFIIKRDPKKKLKFTSLQSEIGESILLEYGYRADSLSSIVFLSGGKAFTKSRAVLEIMRHLPACWPLVYAFIIVPPFIRDWLYDFIAKNRYKWFGKVESCLLPTADLNSRFVKLENIKR